MRFLLLILTLTVWSVYDVNAQIRDLYFVGVQPSVTVEPHYASGSFDVNLLPLTVQVPVSGRADLRVAPVVNYHVGNDARVAQVGGEIIVPVFLDRRESTTLPSRGLFVAPVAGVARNFREGGMEYTAAVEPGYFFPIGERWGASLGVQIGTTYFERGATARSHFGVKASFGRWIRS